MEKWCIGLTNYLVECRYCEEKPQCKRKQEEDFCKRCNLHPYK